MTPDCVCIRCAEGKRDPYEACLACGFTPETDEDYAKTLILSGDYRIFDTDRTLPPEQLREAWAKLKAGTFAFDPLEVSEVAAFFDLQKRYFASLTKREIARQLVFTYGILLCPVFGMAAFAFYRHHSFVLSTIALLLCVELLPVLAFRIYLVIPFGADPPPDEMERWLNEPRAVETSPATGSLPADLEPPEEAASLFQRFGRIRIRHTAIEISPAHLADVPGKPELMRIGVWERGDVLIDRRSGEVREVEGKSVRSKYRSIGVFVTAVCDHEFRHLREQLP